MLIPSLPLLSQPLGLPVCLTASQAARLWLKDAVTRVKERPGFPSLEDSANLPPPDVIAAEIVEDLQAALAQFAAVTDAKQRSGFQSAAHVKQ
jgi:hypothetical protein